MKNSLIILLLSFVATFANAQSILYDNSFFNIISTNPAFAGARKDFNLDALFGNRFNGTISPQQISQIIALDGQVGQRENGLGFQAFNSSSSSYTNSQGVLLDYAYRTQVGESGSFSLGLRGGFTTTSYLGLSQFFPYFGAGALLNSDNLFISISEPVIQSKAANVGQPVNLKPLFAAIGYSIEPNDNLMINPSFQYEANSTFGNGYNLASKIWFNKKFGIGITLKHRNESTTYQTSAYTKMIGTLEVQASKTVRFGLSYDGHPDAGGFGQVTTSSGGIGSVFQLYFKYNSSSDRENTNHLRYF